MTTITTHLLVLIVSSLTMLQGQGLELRMRRNVGYASGSDIQGTFTLRASGPQDMGRVSFFIDGQMIGEAAEAPFELRFNTGGYAMGPHTIHAVGTTASGQELQSNEIRVNFVSASQGLRDSMRILAPMFAIIALVTLLVALAPFLGAGKLRALPPGTPRQYGMVGGAICPRCQRPFPRHFFSPNMVFGKLERCPCCGKWSIVAAQPLDALRRAEQAELEDAGQVGNIAQTDAEKLRKELDESRYVDG